MKYQVQENSIKAELCREPPLTPHVFAVRQRGPIVQLGIDGRGVELRTIQAHRAGFDLVTLSARTQAGEAVKLTVNNVEIVLPSAEAKQLGGALLRKADSADDFQIENQMRLVK